MTISETLSTKGISALMDATEYGKDLLGKNFESATVKKLLKNGYWADIEDKDGNIYKISVKINGNETIISRR